MAFAKSKLQHVNWSSFPDRVRYALSNAPEQTRDFFKAEVLKRYSSQVSSVSWSTLVLDEAKITLDEPFMLNKGEIEVGGRIEEIISAAKKLYPDKVETKETLSKRRNNCLV
jgi:ABC-type multidrug transport system ATPase subunit